jgi:hypothetical protein
MLGAGTLADSTVPLLVNDTLFGTNIDSFACDINHCLLTSNGSLIGWGQTTSKFLNQCMLT